jgi:hypothetical protein
VITVRNGFIIVTPLALSRAKSVVRSHRLAATTAKQAAAAFTADQGGLSC